MTSQLVENREALSCRCSEGGVGLLSLVRVTRPPGPWLCRRDMGCHVRIRLPHALHYTISFNALTDRGGMSDWDAGDEIIDTRARTANTQRVRTRAGTTVPAR